MSNGLMGFNIIFLLLLLFLGIIGLVIYFVPTIVALKRNHLNKVAIILINIFLGWSFVGWIVALVWACTNPSPPIIMNNPVPIVPESAADKLQSLSKLRNDGVISEEEFQRKKAEILNRI